MVRDEIRHNMTESMYYNLADDLVRHIAQSSRPVMVHNNQVLTFLDEGDESVVKFLEQKT